MRVAKHVAACHEHVGSCLHERGGGVGVDTAIDLDEGVAACALDEFFELFDFLDGVLDELLAAEAGVDGHEEYHVYVLDDVFKHVDGGVGIEGDACFHACLVYLLDGAVQVGAGFVVDVHHVGSEGFDLLGELAWVDYHEVHVEGFLAQLGYGFKYGETEADVGHEDAVHDVEMEPVGIAAVDHVDVFAQVGKVGRKE